MPRRSSRRPVPKLKQEDEDGLSHFSEAEVKPQKRSAVTVFGELSPKKSPKKPKRTYAMPDKYAHLTGLPDWLKEELDGRPYIVHTWQFNVQPYLSSDVLWHQVSRSVPTE